MPYGITEHVLRGPSGHTSFYLACGVEDAPLIVFVHGWPELSASWRHQLPSFAALGFRCIAPDMRGYGRSSVPPRREDYAMPPIARDMLELLDGLGRERAVWVGHDWGSQVVWSLAAHHAERCHGAASLCVPYVAGGFAPPNLIPLVDRATYPEAGYPAGQWDYMLAYEEDCAAAVAAFEADPAATVRALFRSGNPAARGKPARTATIRRDGGWFGGAGRAPDVLRDPAVLATEAEMHRYAAALARTGFAGPCSWYMNHAANMAYAAAAPSGGRLTMPVLFLHAAHDGVCETIDSRLAEPMRRDCADLTEAVVRSGHWMAQEKPAAVNAALARWLATRLPGVWPDP